MQVSLLSSSSGADRARTNSGVRDMNPGRRRTYLMKKISAAVAQLVEELLAVKAGVSWG
jgi:hypothetical protein